MGLQMALRLHQSLSKEGQGPNLVAWNRTLSKAEPLTKTGAETVQHPAGKVIATDHVGGYQCSWSSPLHPCFFPMLPFETYEC